MLAAGNSSTFLGIVGGSWRLCLLALDLTSGFTGCCCDWGKVLALSELGLHLSMWIIIGLPLEVKGSFNNRRSDGWHRASQINISSCELVFLSLL